MILSFSRLLEQLHHFHYPFRPPDNSVRIINATMPMKIVEKIFGENGKVKRVSADHTDHPMLDKRPGIFAMALAHEVRNPLTNINLAAEILIEDGLTAEQKVYVEMIARGVERINQIVSDFLNSHKAIEARPEICSVNELLDEVLEINKDRMLLKTVGVFKNFSAGNMHISVNRQEIKIALINVLVNAIEALPPENGALKLSTLDTKDKCSIVIEDNGIGISEFNLNKIFDPYFTNKPGGMGLGLSTTRDILSSNHASLEVTSAIGTGSCFTFIFNKEPQP